MGIFTGLFMYGIGCCLDSKPKYKTNTETIIENRAKRGLPPLTQEELRRLINCEYIDKERKRLEREYLK